MPNAEGGGGSLIFTIGYLLFFVAIMYLLIFRPQKKKEKKTREMLSALKVGEKVTTIGGVYGKVINIKDDDVTVETSVEKTQVVFKKWAIKDIEKPVES